MNKKIKLKTVVNALVKSKEYMPPWLRLSKVPQDAPKRKMYHIHKR